MISIEKINKGGVRGLKPNGTKTYAKDFDIGDIPNARVTSFLLDSLSGSRTCFNMAGCLTNGF